MVHDPRQNNIHSLDITDLRIICTVTDEDGLEQGQETGVREGGDVGLGTPDVFLDLGEGLGVGGQGGKVGVVFGTVTGTVGLGPPDEVAAPVAWFDAGAALVLQAEEAENGIIPTPALLFGKLPKIERPDPTGQIQLLPRAALVGAQPLPANQLTPHALVLIAKAGRTVRPRLPDLPHIGGGLGVDTPGRTHKLPPLRLHIRYR